MILQKDECIILLFAFKMSYSNDVEIKYKEV